MWSHEVTDPRCVSGFLLYLKVPLFNASTNTKLTRGAVILVAGSIRARIRGAETATAPILTFLISHCELNVTGLNLSWNVSHRYIGCAVNTSHRHIAGYFNFHVSNLFGHMQNG